MTPKSIEQIFNEVETEVYRAQGLFPNWPTDRIEVAAIVAEEAGEVIQAALNLRPTDPHFKDTTESDYRKELVQTAAMAVRALINLPT